MIKPFHEDARDPHGSYPTLIGPDGWTCTLTEPEDRVWTRDLEPVVTKLNELHADVDRWSADYSREQVRSVRLMGENHVLRQQLADMGKTLADRDAEIDRLRRDWSPSHT